MTTRHSQAWRNSGRFTAPRAAEAEAFSDDARLAGDIRRRDPEAFQAVVHNYLPQIVRAARASGLSPDRAEDVAQETFQAFVEVAARFEGRSKVRTFLFGILYRKIAEARREVTRERRSDPIDEVMEGHFRAYGRWLQPPRSLDQQVYVSEIGRMIEECLEEAPPRQRLAFVLRETEDISTEELCNILDVSRTNVGVLLFRARNRVRECLESRGIKGSVE